jgi:hypothetical protein
MSIPLYIVDIVVIHDPTASSYVWVERFTLFCCSRWRQVSGLLHL